MARFDWYQATIPAPAGVVIEALAALSQEAPKLREGKGKHGFARETVLEGAQGAIARVWWGGSHANPHAVLTGEMAQPGAELIRVQFPAHKVSRADACEDFADPVFDQIQAVMLDVAAAKSIKVDTRGDHLLTKQGRTVYLGAPTSVVRARLYDKAAELRARYASDPVKLLQLPEHLVRFEAQVRPASDKAKQEFATIEPMQLMGCSGWLREVWAKVSGVDLHPVQVGKGWRQADDERAYSYLLAQYGGLLQRMKEDAGSWECLGLQIGHDLAERQKAKRGLGQSPQ